MWGGKSMRGPFTELGYAPGFVRGYRTWRADEEGYLRGLYFRARWEPGETQGLCLARPSTPFYGMMARAEQHTAFAEAPPIPAKHLPECNCGLYAYYEGSNDYYRPSRRTQVYGSRVPSGSEEPNFVMGMVDGYGEVVIGSRGFRAAKARISALVFPDTLVYPGLVLERYPSVPVFRSFEEMVAEVPPVKG